MTLEEIRSQIVYLSGSGKKVVSTRRHGIYSSFTLPGLDDLVAVRDTMRRFDDFAIPKSLAGKSLIDVGSNVGAVAFEAAQRGASVCGVEYRSDRVSLCNIIAARFGLDAKFWQADLNAIDEPRCVRLDPWLTHDIVICSSVDEYIDDVDGFYRNLRQLCDDTLYLESNIQRGVYEIDTIGRLRSAGFFTVEYLGNGHSGGIARKRKLFRACV